MKKYKMPYLGKNRKIRLRIASYQNNGNLAIEIEVKSGLFHWEAWDMLTVNVVPQSGPNFALIDTNKLGDDVVSWLVEKKLAVPTSWAERSGFCLYPQVMFHTDALTQADPEGYQGHIRHWEARKNDGAQNRGEANRGDQDEYEFLFGGKSSHE